MPKARAQKHLVANMAQAIQQRKGEASKADPPWYNSDGLYKKNKAAIQRKSRGGARDTHDTKAAVGSDHGCSFSWASGQHRNCTRGEAQGCADSANNICMIQPKTSKQQAQFPFLEAPAGPRNETAPAVWDK